MNARKGGVAVQIMVRVPIHLAEFENNWFMHLGSVSSTRTTSLVNNY